MNVSFDPSRVDILTPQQISFLQHIFDAIPPRSREPSLAIPAISEFFLDKPYVDDVLVGGPDKLEKLVIDFDRLDCMTLIEYVEAIRRSATPNDFVQNLIAVRYGNSLIDYTVRRHFFSQWVIQDEILAHDVTVQCGGEKSCRTNKTLNWSEAESESERPDGTSSTHTHAREDGKFEFPLLPGIAGIDHVVTYIPAESIDERITSRIEDGDYIGIYAPKQGLDVSHTGIYLRHEGKPYLRHVSSVKGLRKAVDHPFYEYIEGRPGVVVFRANSE